MTRTRNRQSCDNETTGTPIAVPNLSVTLRRIREHRKLSRAQAYRCHGVSPSYLFDLERGEHKPSLDMLEQIIAGYNVDASLARHLRELRAPAVQLPSTEELRLRVSEDGSLMAHMWDLQERGVIAAYMSPVWNVLARNDLMRTTLPGLEKAGSLPVWMFGPDAKAVAVDWDRDADLTVASLRGVLGRYRNAEQTFDVLRRLRDSSDFRRRWMSSLRVSFARDSSDPVRLRHACTDETTAYSVTFTGVNEASDVLLMTVLRKQ